MTTTGQTTYYLAKDLSAPRKDWSLTGRQLTKDEKGAERARYMGRQLTEAEKAAEAKRYGRTGL